VLLCSVPAVERVVLDGENTMLEPRNINDELGTAVRAPSRQPRGAAGEEASALLADAGPAAGKRRGDG
jgi:hypothetical protein